MSDKKISELEIATTLDPDAIIPISQIDPQSNLLRTYGVHANQFASLNTINSYPGHVLLGKLLGVNMNLADTNTIKYTDSTGFQFQLFDAITVLNGAWGSINSVDKLNSIITLSKVDTSKGAFNVGDTITSSIAEIIFSSQIGIINGGDTITGSTSGATALVISNDGTSQLLIDPPTGIFIAGETITSAQSSATAVISSYTAPASAVIESYSFVSGAQAITLSGGSKYLIKDIVITNATTHLNHTSGVSFKDSAGHIFSQNGGADINTLGPSPAYINFGVYKKDNNTTITNTSPLYFSIDTPQGAAATADIYVYGYVLE
jgi:hypothetical protein